MSHRPILGKILSIKTRLLDVDGAWEFRIYTGPLDSDQYKALMLAHEKLQLIQIFVSGATPSDA